MKRNWLSWAIAVLAVTVLTSMSAMTALADPMEGSCSDLIRRVQALRQDIKTVNIVLGSAIDAGSLDRIKGYKLRRKALDKQLNAVMKAIRTHECIVDR